MPMLMLVLVLIDVQTNASPIFNLRKALRVFGVAWRGVAWRGVAWPKFEQLLRTERSATLAPNHGCAQSATLDLNHGCAQSATLALNHLFIARSAG
jgi:hypothetical protein